MNHLELSDLLTWLFPITSNSDVAIYAFEVKYCKWYIHSIEHSIMRRKALQVLIVLIQWCALLRLTNYNIHLKNRFLFALLYFLKHENFPTIKSYFRSKCSHILGRKKSTKSFWCHLRFVENVALINCYKLRLGVYNS